MDYANNVAEQLLQIKAIKLNTRTPYTWASGIKSPIYCDNRIALSFPHVRNLVKKALISKSDEFPAFDVVAGVATAGIPHGALLADALGLPFVYVRSKAKEHGRQNQIEGSLEQNARVLVIEDLISTGGSSMDAIQALLTAGAQISGLLAIFTYEFEKAKELFSEAQIPVKTLTGYGTLIAIAEKLQYIENKDLELLRSWRKDPHSWLSK
ncbi:MAG: orotate phosphoribosyltransferase [Saprospiraceae bacterium]|nr:orotate phosphoribosyltransferase [Saprospiraceae bacterium]